MKCLYIITFHTLEKVKLAISQFLSGFPLIGNVQRCVFVLIFTRKGLHCLEWEVLLLFYICTWGSYRRLGTVILEIKICFGAIMDVISVTHRQETEAPKLNTNFTLILIKHCFLCSINASVERVYTKLNLQKFFYGFCK